MCKTGVSKAEYLLRGVKTWVRFAHACTEIVYACRVWFVVSVIIMTYNTSFGHVLVVVFLFLLSCYFAATG